MEWTQWLFIGIVKLLVIAFAVAIWRNPQRFVTKIYTNPLVVFGLGAIAMITFGWFAGEHTALEKAAFGGGSLLSIRYFTIAAGFADMFKPKPSVMVTRLDINMVIMVLYSLAILVGLLSFVGVQQFADAAVEALVGAVVAGLLTVGEIYMTKDRMEQKQG